MYFIQGSYGAVYRGEWLPGAQRRLLSTKKLHAEMTEDNNCVAIKIIPLDQDVKMLRKV